MILSGRILMLLALRMSSALAMKNSEYGLAPQITLNGDQVITGANEGSVEVFKGIPFAEPPIGDLRFRKPAKFQGSYDGLIADKFKGSCYQLNPARAFNLLNQVVDFARIIPSPLEPLLDVGYGSSHMDEDCLFLNVFRPEGTKPGDNLPVFVWIYGGAFQIGSSGTYPGNKFVTESMQMNQPIVFVSINYRLGPFGFLSSPELLDLQDTNNGIKDQRMALEWVQDHIEQFGGNPNQVTIAGQSGGGESVSLQLTAYNGDNLYKGNPLFHGAIMQSGGPLPFDSYDSEHASAAYRRFVEHSGCQDAEDSLQCLREQDVNILNGAINDFTIKELIGFLHLFLGFGPRPDGDIIPDDTFKMYKEGRFAQVPMITGVMEDDGSAFAVALINCTNNDMLRQQLSDIFLKASPESIEHILELYPDDKSEGTPFRTGKLNALTPQWKRMGAILNDIIFAAQRRQILQNRRASRCWTYFSTAFHKIIPFVGTFHASEITPEFYLDLSFGQTFRRYWIAFTNHFDPNVGSNLTQWDEYTDEGKEMLEIKFTKQFMITDEFRPEQVGIWIEDETLRF